MNKHWYSYGNTFKARFKNHNCYKCGTKLEIVLHSKIVDQKSTEAKYYDFDAGMDGGIMVGPCEFIHKVFYCPKCCENIEFITQINQEDIDKLIKKVKKRCLNNGRKITVSKHFETKDGLISKEMPKFEHIKNLCLVFEESEKETLNFKVPPSQKKHWERPYYFPIRKKQLVDVLED